MRSPPGRLRQRQALGFTGAECLDRIPPNFSAEPAWPWGCSRIAQEVARKRLERQAGLEDPLGVLGCQFSEWVNEWEQDQQ